MSPQTKQPRRKFTLRIPEPLAERLEQVAADAGHSLNAEIVARLRASLEGWKR